ncbi:MAG: hypothetical protein JO212_05670 [Acetobacteraceae bacterium]|nr:hypothetical protein [Acetobacteraceae bacterium]
MRAKSTTGQQSKTIVVVEPTYRDAEHAPVNAAMLQALSLACPGHGLVFAATREHCQAIQDVTGATASALAFREIAVLPPGGISLRRMRAQWRAIAGAVRQHAPQTAVLLSSGPETFFVCRALVTAFPSLRLFVIQHGGLAEIVGWRSRDPRRRLFDYRSGLVAATHSRIYLIVLEEHIKQAACRSRTGPHFHVWPHPLPPNEHAPCIRWNPGPTLRIASVGAVKRAKGFADFLLLARGAANGPFKFHLVGPLYDRFDQAELTGIERPANRLGRAEYLYELRRADYAFMSFKGTYDLTASGSLLDCVGQLKPIIATRTPLLETLAEKYGPIGFLCPDIDALARLLAAPERLRDRAAYSQFQHSLDTMRRDRSPAALAPIIHRHFIAPSFAPDHVGRSSVSSQHRPWTAGGSWDGSFVTDQDSQSARSSRIGSARGQIASP